jgi:isopenicillin N synthase-like dioxygenase
MWPQDNLLPGFREVIGEYMTRMGKVAAKFTSLVAEAIGLPHNAFDQFFEPKGGRWQQQHKLKIVKYPDVADLPTGATTQGVGPHKGTPHAALSNYRLHAIKLSTSSNEPSWTTGSKL